MNEKPILFSGPMVRAILAGTKTQTRRVLKRQPSGILAGPNYDGLWSDTKDPVARYFACPYGFPGDRLWVRETWCPRGNGVYLLEQAQRPFYAADDGGAHGKKLEGWRWRPSIHMPRWASRITLEIVSVRVERLQEISEEDAIAEGIERDTDGRWHDYEPRSPRPYGWLNAKGSYRTLWESINGPGSWAANPCVWAIEFRRVQP